MLTWVYLAMIRFQLEPVIAYDGEVRFFAHIYADKVFGYAKVIKAALPKGVLVTVPPKYQPAIDWYLERKCGFVKLGTVDIDDEENVVLKKKD